MRVFFSSNKIISSFDEKTLPITKTERISINMNFRQVSLSIDRLLPIGLFYFVVRITSYVRFSPKLSFEVFRLFLHYGDI